VDHDTTTSSGRDNQSSTSSPKRRMTKKKATTRGPQSPFQDQKAIDSSPTVPKRTIDYSTIEKPLQQMVIMDTSPRMPARQGSCQARIIPRSDEDRLTLNNLNREPRMTNDRWSATLTSCDQSSCSTDDDWSSPPMPVASDHTPDLSCSDMPHSSSGSSDIEHSRPRVHLNKTAPAPLSSKDRPPNIPPKLPELPYYQQSRTTRKEALLLQQVVPNVTTGMDQILLGSRHSQERDLSGHDFFSELIHARGENNEDSFNAMHSSFATDLDM
jgi:hypothetical protein